MTASPWNAGPIVEEGLLEVLLSRAAFRVGLLTSRELRLISERGLFDCDRNTQQRLSMKVQHKVNKDDYRKLTMGDGVGSRLAYKLSIV